MSTRQNVVKIVAVAIFVLGLQNGAFAAPKAKAQGESALLVFDRRLTPKKLARSVRDLRRNARYITQGMGWREFGFFDNWDITTPPISNPESSQTVLGRTSVILKEEQGGQMLLRRTRKGGLATVEITRTSWSADVLQLSLWQTEPGPPATVLNAQVVVSHRRPGNFPHGSVINVSDSSGTAWRNPARYLPIIREVLLRWAPAARRVTRR